MIRLLAFRADSLAKALGQHAEHGVGKVERVTAEVEQPDNGFDCAVGMQRAEYKMPGQGSLNGYIGRFLVTHFADHDYVRVGS